MEPIQIYGINLLKNTNDIFTRKIGFIDDKLSIEENIMILTNKFNIDLDMFLFKKIEKVNEKGFFMKWHLDDAQIINNKKEIKYKNHIEISEKKSIYYSNEIPTYSLIIYLSEHNLDFKGGSFEFVDKKIYPKKNMYIFFDSREVHRVNKITGGHRHNYLIKFYKISR